MKMLAPKIVKKDQARQEFFMINNMEQEICQVHVKMASSNRTVAIKGLSEIRD